MASEHGGLDYCKLHENGINPDDVLDFSVSINPFPLPFSVEKAIKGSRVTRYPDSSCNLLSKKIAEFNNVQADEILVVNGTSQGMYLIVSTLLQAENKIAIVQPSYSGYEDASRLKSSHIININREISESFNTLTEKIVSCVQKDKPALLWLCSPNNPTGHYLEEDNYERIRQACIQNRTTFILDEAYISFVPSQKRYSSFKDNVIVLRSMTKDFCIPGLRLGYLMGDAAVLSKIKRWQPEWSISAPAQDAGVAAYDELEYYQDCWKQTVLLRHQLQGKLKTMGLKVYDSSANFFLVEINNVNALKSHLWEDLILVRDCRSFKLNNMIRIGVRTEAENNALVNSIREYLKK